jgi:hypothetical protein
MGYSPFTPKPETRSTFMFLSFRLSVNLYSELLSLRAVLPCRSSFFWRARSFFSRSRFFKVNHNITPPFELSKKYPLPRTEELRYPRLPSISILSHFISKVKYKIQVTKKPPFGGLLQIVIVLYFVPFCQTFLTV